MGIILMDVDGVVADFLTATFTQFEERTGKRIDPAALTRWQWDRPENGFVDAQDLKEIHKIWNEPGFCESIEPYDYAQELVDAARSVGSVVFVTSPMFTENWHIERTRWLMERFNAKFSDIIFTSRKELVGGDTLIDDKVQHVERWIAAQRRTGIVWAQSYNAIEFEEANKFLMYRTDNVYDAVDLLHVSISTFGKAFHGR